MSSEVDASEFVRTVATNVRALRLRARMTLADLAAAAGLGKSTLAQLESGRGNPSVETLWAIAAALRVPFGRLMEDDRPPLRVIRAYEQPTVHSSETSQVGRLLIGAHRRGTFELYAMDIGPAVRHADPHHAGVVEHLLVVEGALRAGPAEQPVDLAAGDLITFGGDVPHVYEGLPEAHYVLLMSYP